jgi:hypothetical protein
MSRVRMNRTLLEECFRVAGRTTWYERIDEIQGDLDRFLAYYNLERSHQATGSGQHAAQAPREGLHVGGSPGTHLLTLA